MRLDGRPALALHVEEIEETVKNQSENWVSEAQK